VDTVKDDARKHENASARAMALVDQALDVIRRTEQAPLTPIRRFIPVHLRRELRRNAKRLHQQKMQPRYPNLHSAEELAGIYERTVLRDEILEQAKRELDEIGRELEGMLEDPEARQAVGMLVLQAEVAAGIDGPGSEAAERFRQLAKLVHRGHRHLLDLRRQRSARPSGIHPAADLSLQEGAAAELLAVAPPGEPVLSFPPEGQDSGRGRVLFRIGLGKGSWIGSFERGEIETKTVRLLPDQQHLFVCAEGAGYVIHLQSRTLLSTTGTRITGVMYDDPVSIFVVQHDHSSLEAFGTAGRLWKTETIGTGGFRGMELTDDSLAGEACQASPPGWVRFSVKLATGEVTLADASAAT
jgi:hypothetical protein